MLETWQNVRVYWQVWFFPGQSKLMFKDNAVLLQHLLHQVLGLLLIHTPHIMELLGICCHEMPVNVTHNQWISPSLSPHCSQLSILFSLSHGHIFVQIIREFIRIYYVKLLLAGDFVVLFTQEACKIHILLLNSKLVTISLNQGSHYIYLDSLRFQIFSQLYPRKKKKILGQTCGIDIMSVSENWHGHEIEYFF